MDPIDLISNEISIAPGSIWERKSGPNEWVSSKRPRIYAVISGSNNHEVYFNRYILGPTGVYNEKEYTHTRFEFLYYYGSCENEDEALKWIERYTTREML